MNKAVELLKKWQNEDPVEQGRTWDHLKIYLTESDSKIESLTKENRELRELAGLLNRGAKEFEFNREDQEKVNRLWAMYVALPWLKEQTKGQEHPDPNEEEK